MQQALELKPRTVASVRTRGDRIFHALARTAGFATLAILALIGFFLLVRAIPALRVSGFRFLIEQAWRPDTSSHVFGIAAVLFGTVQLAVIALCLAVPVSIATALFITQYAPLRAQKVLTALVDLLAAVPSLIYGMWGLAFLQPRLLGTESWLSRYLGFIPFFKNTTGQFPSSPFITGVVLAIMVVPICTSVMREVFSQAPATEKEGALALGGTRWGMIRTVVLPFGRGGIIGGSMLGLGRALGETIAVAIIISPIFNLNWHITQTGANSIAALIALRFGESQRLGLSALMAAGLTLFGLTLVVNMAASSIVSRSRSGKGVEL